MTEKTKVVTPWDRFSSGLTERAAEIAVQLPKHISKERFLATAHSAVKQTPDLLQCTPRSLFAAITKSAQDGLLPDGREGVITYYKNKKRGIVEASWNPMIYGLRKRAKQLDGILVDAQVVHEKDEFDQQFGDNPTIIHKPPQLGKTRGKMVGAYAIFRDAEHAIIHREVMDRAQIEKVKKQSKAQDGLLWTQFEEEAWRKTVARRGIKSVPCSEELESIARRDDELFDFNDGEMVDITPPPAPAIESGGGEGDPTAAGGGDDSGSGETKEQAPSPDASRGKEEPHPDEQTRFDPDAYMNSLSKTLTGLEAGDVPALEKARDLYDEVYAGKMFPPDQEEVEGMFKKAYDRLGP